MNEQSKRTSGPDFMDVMAKSEFLGSAQETLTELRMQALGRAREMYGADARLEVTKTGTLVSLSGGRCSACVTVRCLNFPEEDL